MKSNLVHAFFAFVWLFFTLIFSGNVRAAESILAHPPLSISIPEAGSVLLFFSRDLNGEELISSRIITMKDGGDEVISVDNYLAEGGSPATVESAFLEDVNRDSVKDLVVLVKWVMEKAALDTSGDFYRIYIYDGRVGDAIGKKLARLEAEERKVPSGFDGVKEGQKKTYPFKSASAIRKALRSK